MFLERVVLIRGEEKVEKERITDSDGEIRDFGNIRWADHVPWTERGIRHEILQKRHQNPGAISRYFNAQKAGPSLDSLGGKKRGRGRVYPPLAKGPLIKTVTRPVRHLVSARILGLTARSKNNTDVNPIRGSGPASRIEKLAGSDRTGSILRSIRSWRVSTFNQKMGKILTIQGIMFTFNEITLNKFITGSTFRGRV